MYRPLISELRHANASPTDHRARAGRPRHARALRPDRDGPGRCLQGARQREGGSVGVVRSELRGPGAREERGGPDPRAQSRVRLGGATLAGRQDRRPTGDADLGRDGRHDGPEAGPGQRGVRLGLALQRSPRRGLGVGHGAGGHIPRLARDDRRRWRGLGDAGRPVRVGEAARQARRPRDRRPRYGCEVVHHGETAGHGRDDEQALGTLAGVGLYVLTWWPLLSTLRRPTPVSIRSLSFAAVILLLVTPCSAPAQAYDSTVFAGLTWREIGIFRGGRSVAVAGSAARSNEYWFGTTGGGVWKTTDGGKTWTFLGLAETQQIARVRVHPTNPDIVYVAAQGHAFGPNPERGVYKTTDGGKTWNKVLFRNDSTGAADLILDPANPNVLYAGLWQAVRRPWTLVSGGAGSGLFKSTDAGEHWTELTKNPGLPAGLWGNIGIAVSGAKPARVWALIEADSGGVYRSDDSGSTWKYVNSDHKLRERAWYCSKIFADPKDSNAVWAPEVNLFKSTDGGVTFRHVIDPHGDNHDLWIASNDANRLIEGNDGGPNVSFNGGKTWTDQDVATAQFYHVETTNHFPYRVCGAQQDNSGVCGPSRWPGGIDRGQWYDVSGESGYIQARPDNPDITYGGDNSAFLGRVDHKTNAFRFISPWPDSPDGHPAAEGKYRFQWTARLRKEVDRRDAEGIGRFHARVDHRGLALRPGHRVRGGEPLPAGGHGALHLEDHGLRAHLDQDREGPAGHRVRAGGAGGPRAARVAVRGHRAWGVGVVRRRGQLADPASQPAHRAGAPAGEGHAARSRASLQAA